MGEAAIISSRNLEATVDGGGGGDETRRGARDTHVDCPAAAATDPPRSRRDAPSTGEPADQSRRRRQTDRRCADTSCHRAAGRVDGGGGAVAGDWLVGSDHKSPITGYSY